MSARSTLSRRLLSGALVAVTALGLTSSLATTADAAPAKKYDNCTALNKDYPAGVGLPGAADRTNGKAKNKPVTNFTRSKAVYTRNTHLDRDKDKIACERYTTTPAPRTPASKPATKPAGASVTIATATATPQAGKPVAVEGVVKGLPAGTSIEVQTTQGRTWRASATSTVRASGRYTAHLTLTAKGRTNVRVVATSGKTTATSPTVTVTVR